MTKATIKIYHDNRKPKLDGTSPISIRITYNRKQKYYGTTLAFTDAEFLKIEKNFRLTEEQRNYRAKLDALVYKAQTIIDTLEPFTFDAFKTRFTGKGNRSDVFVLINEKIELIGKEEKFNNRNLYKQTGELLSKYHTTISSNPELPLQTITPRWLKAFENWALTEPKQKNGEPKYSKSTINTYAIRLRAIFNEAISNGDLDKNLYPFHTPTNKKGYKIPPVANNKRALPIRDIMKIFHYDPANKGEQFAKDVFMFSYLASGINPTDIFNLKHTDIEDGQFSFLRQKTKNRSNDPIIVQVHISTDLQEILDRVSSSSSDNIYVFDVLSTGMTTIAAYKTIKNTISSINVSLKKIASKLDITTDVSLYFARHSFATGLLINEAPLAYISQQLGHASIVTTQTYLGSFPKEQSDKYSKLLLKKDV